jgi:NAD(P)-dependent dehydrogenase (short-subunit alcohol dehydrogenase family)
MKTNPFHQTVIVTGGATRIGYAVAAQFVERRANVLLDHRRHRRSAGDCQNPYSSGPADPRPGAASRFIPDNLRAENRLPTQADGAARSEFERAARSGTLRAPPTTTPPKPAEATLGFSSTRKTIDNSPAGDIARARKKVL